VEAFLILFVMNGDSLFKLLCIRVQRFSWLYHLQEVWLGGIYFRQDKHSWRRSLQVRQVNLYEQQLTSTKLLQAKRVHQQCLALE
jgi:hypothetical protein